MGKNQMWKCPKCNKTKIADVSYTEVDCKDCAVPMSPIIPIIKTSKKPDDVLKHIRLILILIALAVFVYVGYEIYHMETAKSEVRKTIDKIW